MKLSFVIPAHNEEKIIGPCLESVIKETKNCPFETEIIVVNNASVDRTGKIARAYKGVKVVDEPIKGLPRARQAGFLASRGDLIANIDADTRLPVGWINKVIKEFSANKNLVALSGPQVHYDLPLSQKILTQIFYLFVFWAYFVNRHIFRVGSMVQGGNFIVRRSALEKINGFNLNLDFYGEDADLAKRLFRVGQVKFTLKLPIYASGRRLVKEGIMVMGARYALNYFWIIFFKKPFTKLQILK